MPNERTTVQVLCVLAVPSTNVCSNIVHLPPKSRRSRWRRNHHIPLWLISSPGPCPTDILLGTTRRNRLPGGDSRTRSGPLAPLQEIMPEDQDRTSYKNRRVRTNDNAAHQRERESAKHLAAEKQQRQRGKQRESRRQNGPAQGVIHTA